MVDPHPRRPLQRQRPGQRQQPGLGRGVGGGAGLRVVRGDAADIDDGSAVRLLTHHQVRGLRDVEGGQQVQRDDLLHEPGRDGGRLRVRGAPGIVHQDVQPPEPGGGGVDQRCRLRGVADVAGVERRRPSARRGQRRRFAAPADQHLRPGGEEGLGDGAADALGATGDQYRPAGEVQRVAGALGHAACLLCRSVSSWPTADHPNKRLFIGPGFGRPGRPPTPAAPQIVGSARVGATRPRTTGHYGTECRTAAASALVPPARWPRRRKWVGHPHV